MSKAVNERSRCEIKPGEAKKTVIINMKIVFGTRKSVWALSATNSVIDKARQHSPEVDFRIVQLDSPGDLDHGDLAKLGGTTSFVDALSREVAAGKIDAAVHTVKDISWPSNLSDFPEGTLLPQGLRTTGSLLLGAVSKRGDARDALVFRQGESFKNFSDKTIRIGTGSLVRAAAIKALYPNVAMDISRIRGNIDLRLEKLDSGDFDALILSMDGLLAVNQAARANNIFSLNEMPPALGQAIGAVEVREDNVRTLAAIGPVNDNDTVACLRAEWATIRAIGATCNTPLAGFCETNPDKTLTMFAVMYRPDGTRIEARIEKASAENPEDLGIQIADMLIANGSEKVTRSWQGQAGELSQDAT